MHPCLHRAAPAPASTPTPGPSANPDHFRLGLAVENQVQSGLCLFLRLKSPAQMGALLQCIQAVGDQVRSAMKNLHYVHFARFVPTPDFSALMVITEFDGDPDIYNQGLNSYLMDFVVTLGDVFNQMLDFVADAPRLPVQKYPRDFIAFVQANNMPIPVWSAYPTTTVIDVLTSRPAR